VILGTSLTQAADPKRSEGYPSPVALSLSQDGLRLLVANQGTGSVALVDLQARKVVAEIPTGDRPAGVAWSNDGKKAVVTHWFGYDLAIIDVTENDLTLNGRVQVGPEPRGVAISHDGDLAYVAVGVSNELVRVDLKTKLVTGRIEVGREPRGVAISPDGKRLAVGNSRGESIAFIDRESFKVERTASAGGANLRQVVFSPDGMFAYVPNMQNRGMATTSNNIDLGWVLGQRLSRLKVTGTAPVEVLSLDPAGKAVGDVHGLAISPDGNNIAISAGGTHELLLLRTNLSPLPWRDKVGRDLIAQDLLKDKSRFRRVTVGGRPLELAFAPDGNTIYAVNYFANSIQKIDFAKGELVDEISLGGPSTTTLVRQGEVLFYDASRSSNQWYSCATCHSDAHTNGLDFDTMNDGWHDYSTAHLYSRKKVPTLRRVAKTAPWTWHGWQKSLDDATVESFTKSMQGKRPTSIEAKAVVAFLETLDFPKNPNLDHDNGLSPAARRGEAIFRSNKARCSSCHSGPEFTDGKIHEVGLEDPRDVYRGFNPPSLRGVYDKDPYLHDGRAKTLRDVLTGDHNPRDLGGQALTDAEVNDLIAYLKTL
jgi:YVTN family beta-propeller protein